MTWLLEIFPFMWQACCFKGVLSLSSFACPDCAYLDKRFIFLGGCFWKQNCNNTFLITQLRCRKCTHRDRTCRAGTALIICPLNLHNFSLWYPHAYLICRLCTLEYVDYTPKGLTNWNHAVILVIAWFLFLQQWGMQKEATHAGDSLHNRQFFSRGDTGQKPKHAPFCMKGATTRTSLHQIGPNLDSNWCWLYKLPKHVLRFRQVALRTEWQDYKHTSCTFTLDGCFPGGMAQ